MKMKFVLLLNLLWLHVLATRCTSQNFDFFYFVQQWPGSYCDTKRSCCYPRTGKPPADFSIHGLWPNYNDGSYPSNCDSGNNFDQSQISDLIKNMQRNWPTLACPSGDGLSFWAHEWNKHGTCSESILNQHEYFQTALNQLRQILGRSGIKPNGELYSLASIKDAIKGGIGFDAWIQCNTDPSGNSQLYQVYCAWTLQDPTSLIVRYFHMGNVIRRLSFLPFDF